MREFQTTWRFCELHLVVVDVWKGGRKGGVVGRGEKKNNFWKTARKRGCFLQTFLV